MKLIIKKHNMKAPFGALWRRGIAGMAMVLTACLASHPSLASTQVTPERTTTVILSNLDVNRIVCTSGRIQDVFYSEEKGVVVKPTKHNVFVKLKMKRKLDTGEIIRPVLDVDLHVVCGGEVYTIIGKLRPVPVQTIWLVDKTGKAKKNLKLLGAMPEEKRILTLMKHAYKNEYPDSYTVTEINEPYAEMGPMLIDKARVIKVEGIGLKVTEYHITVKHETRIQERDFLRPEFGKQVAAISIDTEQQPVRPGDNVRLFVMERTVP